MRRRKAAVHPVGPGGPCLDHACDGCERCQGGRCCRSDRPGYHLPDEGSITPYYGEIGVRNDMGDKVECHVCGSWFVALIAHIWGAHDLNAAEYKSAFGLTRKGIVSSDYSARRSEIARQRMAEGSIKLTPGGGGNLTREQRQMYLARSESKRSHRKANATVLPKLLAASHSSESIAKMRATKARQTEEISENRVCPECGTTFRVPRWVTKLTCSKACRKAHLRKTASASIRDRLARGWKPAIHHPDAEQKRRIGEATKAWWASLSPEQRAIEHERRVNILDPEVRQRAMVASGKAQAKRRKPHPCPACGKMMPRATPITCSAECRREIRRRTGLASATKKWADPKKRRNATDELS